MNRRGFLSGATAAIAAALLPKVPRPRSPSLMQSSTWTWTDTAGKENVIVCSWDAGALATALALAAGTS